MSGEVKIRDCKNNCGTQIYWSVEDNFYVEYDSGERHMCPNWQKSGGTTTTKPSVKPIPPFRPPGTTTKEKIKTGTGDDGLTIFAGTQYADLETKYIYICNVIKKHGGKVHGSQSHIQRMDDGIFMFFFVIYYEVPENMSLTVREELKIEYD